MTKIKNSVSAGILFGLLYGTFLAFEYGITRAIISAPIMGLFFGFFFHLFIHSKMLERLTKVEIKGGETIIHSDGANHFKNCEGVGGQLYLLTDKLRFKSHRLNIQTHELVIDIDQIEDITFYTCLGMFPNGLAISLKDGTKEKFVVNDRELWKTEIDKLRAIPIH